MHWQFGKYLVMRSEMICSEPNQVCSIINAFYIDHILSSKNNPSTWKASPGRFLGDLEGDVDDPGSEHGLGSLDLAILEQKATGALG